MNKAICIPKNWFLVFFKKIHFKILTRFTFKIKYEKFLNLRVCDTYHKSNLVFAVFFPQFLIFQ